MLIEDFNESKREHLGDIYFRWKARWTI